MKRKLILIISIFVISFISHYMYNIFPNSLFSILFPVNESIWEHMKLLVTPILIVMLIERLIVKSNNYLLAYITSSILGVILYLLLYLPLNNIFGYNPIIAISLLFVIDIFIVIISSCIINYKNIKYSNIIGIVLIIITYTVFYVCTYYPSNNNIFLDITDNTYGIKKTKYE